MGTLGQGGSCPGPQEGMPLRPLPGREDRSGSAGQGHQLPTRMPPAEAKSSVAFKVAHAEQHRPPPSPLSRVCRPSYTAQQTQHPLPARPRTRGCEAVPRGPSSPTAPARTLLRDLRDPSPGSWVWLLGPCPPSPGAGTRKGRGRGWRRGLRRPASAAPVMATSLPGARFHQPWKEPTTWPTPPPGLGSRPLLLVVSWSRASGAACRPAHTLPGPWRVLRVQGRTTNKGASPPAWGAAPHSGRPEQVWLREAGPREGDPPGRGLPRPLGPLESVPPAACAPAGGAVGLAANPPSMAETPSPPRGEHVTTPPAGLWGRGSPPNRPLRPGSHCSPPGPRAPGT